MTAASSATESQSDKRDHRREVTDSIIKMLEDGVAPWQKPWQGAAMPFNPTTERSYRGGNAVHLITAALGRGYADPRWMTYKQAAEHGWQVRKGEKGTPIEFWDIKPGREQDAENTDEDNPDKRRLIHRTYFVFNAQQIDGIPPLVTEPRTPF